jgi:hypothetical protein
MRKTHSIIFLLQVIAFFPTALFAQTVPGRIRFDNGQKFLIHMDVKTSVAQQVSGNAIDFTATALAVHQYDVLRTTPDSTDLHHKINSISFDFEGMGQKRSFSSENDNDMGNEFGAPVKNLLDKKFDITIDANGRVIRTKAEKAPTVKTDERMNLILSMLRDVADIAYPQPRGRGSFFRILPARDVSVGDSWYDSVNSESARFKTNYTLSALTDSTIIIDFKTTSSTITKATMMGRETTTTMNSTGEGQIIADRSSGIIRQKKSTTESHGSTEAMGGLLPVTAKTTIIIHVKPG